MGAYLPFELVDIPAFRSHQNVVRADAEGLDVVLRHFYRVVQTQVVEHVLLQFRNRVRVLPGLYAPHDYAAVETPRRKHVRVAQDVQTHNDALIVLHWVGQVALL